MINNAKNWILTFFVSTICSALYMYLLWSVVSVVVTRHYI